MKNNIKNILGIFCIAFFAFGLVSCTYKKDSSDILAESEEGTKLNRGAVLSNDNGTYSNYNIENNECVKVDSDEQIWSYDYDSDNYFGVKNEKYFAFYNGKRISLDSVTNNDQNFKISPGGKYLLFLRNDNGYVPKIINLEDGSEVKFDSDVLISGKLIDWVGKDEIAYYGVNTNKNQNGVFTYNISTGSEDVAYEFDYGDALFLKGYENGVIFLQEQVDEGRFLKKIDLSTQKVQVLSGKVSMVYDLVKTADDNIYIIGKVKDNTVSLYQISDSTTRRMIYDFPKEINIDKGLKLDENGNILFIGVNDGSVKEDIFKCTQRGDISIIKNTSNEYVFVN